MSDNGSQFVPTTNGGGNGGSMKRPMSLDLNAIGKPSVKKPKLNPLTTPLMLDSPSNPITTPDLEKIILSNPLLPTPSTITNNLFSQKVTNEQDKFANGFVEALQNLHNKNEINHSSIVQQQAPQPPPQQLQQTTTAHTNGISGGTFTYTNLTDESYPVVVKDEPNVSSTPPHSPIDMETQEKIKLERKRQRNRVAASKCRKRKLERISKLEDKVKCLKGENADLGLIVKQLKDHICQLKEKVIAHINAGCEVPVCNNAQLLTAK